ncbi:MAG: hypothetical protein PHI97_30340 [Desulfobulbus sp.]|nr:hypothetical protein [Desulfobulbus sp.]
MKKRLLILTAPLVTPCVAFAEDWTPLVSSTTFDGIKADVILACGSIFVLGLIIFGIGVLMRAVR